MTTSRWTALLGWMLSMTCGASVAAAAAAVPPPIEFGVSAKGETVGTIGAKVDSQGLGGGVRGNEGMTGSFTVTKKKPDGSTMSLDELEAFLGQNHLNWFQKVTRDTNPPNDCSGNPLTPPYVDPPNGGYCGPGTTSAWGDGRPWYWNETPRPASETKPDPGQLSDNSTGSKLEFSDYPSSVNATGPIPGASVDFVTFLISDFGNKTYSVLGGFSWGIQMVKTPVNDIHGNPIIVTNVTTLAASPPFTDEYAKEISTFGYTQVPEPPTWCLVLQLGGLMLVGVGRRQA